MILYRKFLGSGHERWDEVFDVTLMAEELRFTLTKPMTESEGFDKFFRNKIRVTDLAIATINHTVLIKNGEKV